MKIHHLRADITQLDVDVIVNAAKSSLAGGGGVDGAIHYWGGPRLTEAASIQGPLATGKVRVTLGYQLPARWVFHTVGPIWDESPDPINDLKNCYRNCLQLANIYDVQSIAFPWISTGIYGFPFNLAVETVLNILEEFKNLDLDLYLISFSENEFQIVEKYLSK